MTSNGYMDAHCHLADPQFKNNLEEVLNRSIQSGIGEWIQGGVGPEDWNRQIEIHSKWKGKIHLAFGMHPWWVAENSIESLESAFEILEGKIAQAELLGEVGLDYLPQYESQKEKQIRFFEKQLELNQKHQKPLILHVVHGHQDALAILKKFSFKKAIVHSFSEGKEILKQYLELGFLISVGPGVIKKGYRRLKEAIPLIPLNQLVLETDCPDSNGSEPSKLLEIAQKVSELRKDIGTEELLTQSTKNLEKILNSNA